MSKPFVILQETTAHRCNDQIRAFDRHGFDADERVPAYRAAVATCCPPRPLHDRRRKQPLYDAFVVDQCGTAPTGCVLIPRGRTVQEGSFGRSCHIPALIGVSDYVGCVVVNQIGGVGRNTAVPRAAGLLLEAPDAFAGCCYKLLCLFGGDVVFIVFSFYGADNLVRRLICQSIALCLFSRKAASELEYPIRPPHLASRVSPHPVGSHDSQVRRLSAGCCDVYERTYRINSGSCATLGPDENRRSVFGSTMSL